MNKPKYDGLAALRNMAAKCHFNIETVPEEANKLIASKDYKVAFMWFYYTKMEAVFILRLYRKDRPYHAITVDTRAGLIYDNERPFAYRLTLAALWACAGVPAGKREIVEARVVRGYKKKRSVEARLACSHKKRLRKAEDLA